MRRILILLIAVTIIGTVGCLKDEIYDRGELISGNYFPLEIGRETVYQIDTIYFYIQSNIVKDTVSWMVTETITDTTHKADGRVLYNLKRSKHKAGKSDIIYDAAWRLWQDGNEIIRQEGNLPYVKMLTDIRTLSRWNPHKYFDPESVEFNIRANMIKPYANYSHRAYIREIEEYSNNGTQLDSTLLILLVDEEDLYERRYITERYGRDIGLLESMEITVNTQCRIKGGNPIDCEDMDWTDKAEEGYITYKQILSWK